MRTATPGDPQSTRLTQGKKNVTRTWHQGMLALFLKKKVGGTDLDVLAILVLVGRYDFLGFGQ